MNASIFNGPGTDSLSYVNSLPCFFISVIFPKKSKAKIGGRRSRNNRRYKVSGRLGGGGRRGRRGWGGEKVVAKN